MCAVTPELLQKLHISAPRYTSYPTAPIWQGMQERLYKDHLLKLGGKEGDLSLYFHIPFCHSMCLFCGCSVILNRDPTVEKTYVHYLKKEIALVASLLGPKKRVSQLHFGGGTPTKLSKELLTELFTCIKEHFTVDFSKEVAIEVDPRTVIEDDGDKLRLLHHLGFNRISFGVQDTNKHVQEAIRRRQSYEMSKMTFYLAKELGFKGINIDLIYGLPLQTRDSFDETINEILVLKPDRIALFSYAKVPWLKPHQKAIKDEDLPLAEDKFAIYANARKKLINAGYTAIGMDHFALAHDEMAICYQQKTLQRNFQGYTTGYTQHSIGMGVTAIGYVEGGYFQNHKDLKEYQRLLSCNCLPVAKGFILSKDDQIRKKVIHTLMCDFKIDKKQFKNTYHVSFDHYFKKEENKITELQEKGLVINSSNELLVTEIGELFIRNIAMTFDAYLNEMPQTKFSQSI